MHIDQNKKFDKRSIDQNIREGLVSRKEYDDYLKALPDVSHKIDDGQGAVKEREDEKGEEKEKPKK